MDQQGPTVFILMFTVVISYLFQPVLVPSSDVLVSAMFNYKGKTYFRLYEHSGKENQVSLDYTIGKARCSDIDLACRELASPSNSLLWRPWQIRTVLP